MPLKLKSLTIYDERVLARNTYTINAKGTQKYFTSLFAFPITFHVIFLLDEKKSALIQDKMTAFNRELKSQSTSHVVSIH